MARRTEAQNNTVQSEDGASSRNDKEQDSDLLEMTNVSDNVCFLLLSQRSAPSGYVQIV
jgi:hypothetical protein